MNRVFILAGVLALTVMCASAGVVTLGTFAVNPQSTFLYESSNDTNVSALFINLTCPLGVTVNCVNAAAGSTIQIIGLGAMCYGNSNCPPESSPSLGGVFDTNNTLLNSSSLASGNVNRLTGSVNAGASTNLVKNNAALNTYFGNVDTTIPNDFFIPTGNGITLVVPNGALYLVVGVLDSYFADNTDPSHTLGITINQITPNPPPPPPVPEPATLGLFGAGTAALFALRRYRSR